jgi:hypothetical protein
MRARWRQENLFKYMVEHYGLDHLISHGADPADPKALIPNPEITRLERKIAERTSPKCQRIEDRPARGGRPAAGSRGGYHQAEGGPEGSAVESDDRRVGERSCCCEESTRPSSTGSRSLPTTPKSGCSNGSNATTRTRTTFATCYAASLNCQATSARPLPE